MRYRIISQGEYVLLLRDDGYRIHAMIVAPEKNDSVGKWELWAEYKQCDLPGVAAAVANVLMLEEEQR